MITVIRDCYDNFWKKKLTLASAAFLSVPVVLFEWQLITGIHLWNCSQFISFIKLDMLSTMSNYFDGDTSPSDIEALKLTVEGAIIDLSRVFSRAVTHVINISLTRDSSVLFIYRINILSFQFLSLCLPSYKWTKQTGLDETNWIWLKIKLLLVDHAWHFWVNSLQSSSRHIQCLI